MGSVACGHDTKLAEGLSICNIAGVACTPDQAGEGEALASAQMVRLEDLGRQAAASQRDPEPVEALAQSAVALRGGVPLVGISERRCADPRAQRE